jgi:hypothetical protein
MLPIYQDDQLKKIQVSTGLEPVSFGTNHLPCLWQGILPEGMVRRDASTGVDRYGK